MMPVLAAVVLICADIACASAQPCTASREDQAWRPQVHADDRRVLRVGPARAIKSPRDAARLAHDGDVVLIDDGDYPDATAIWKANGLLIRGVGGRPHMIAGEKLAQGKAIWVINGADAGRFLRHIGASLSQYATSDAAA